MSQFGFAHTDAGTVVPVRRMPNNVLPEIKPGFYSFCAGGEEGPHLHVEEPMKLPKEVYGDSHLNVDRYFRSFELNDKNLGISLVGLKGSGKTMQGIQICIKAVELGYPVIVVNSYVPAALLAEFLKKIDQNVIIFIDEFDKLYFSSQTVSSFSGMSTIDNHSAQDGFLSLLDGVNSNGKKMFVLTSNNPDKISDLLKDRPSRVRYNVKFDLLPNDVLRDYVSKNLSNATIHDVAGFSLLKKMLTGNSTNLFVGGEMNFDTMKELVNEMQQFKEPLRNSWLMMKFGSTKPAGVREVPYLVDYYVFDVSTGEEVPVFYVDAINSTGESVNTPAYCPDGRMAINQLHFHKEDSSFLDVRVLQNGRSVKINDRILKDNYGHKDLLCYDREYFPVYIHGDIIICPESKNLDQEVSASAAAEYQVLKDGKSPTALDTYQGNSQQVANRPIKMSNSSLSGTMVARSTPHEYRPGSY